MKIFSGKVWAGAIFRSREFSGSEVESTPSGSTGGRLWHGKAWENSVFRTRLFRGAEIPSEGGETGGRLWRGRAWANGVFRTRLFRGVPISIPTPPAVSKGSGGSSSNGRMIGPRIPEATPIKKQRIDPALLAAVLAESDELL